MFGRKKKDSSIIRVMHYEGIPNFPVDSPCTFEIKNETVEIISGISGSSAILPLNRVQGFSAMAEPDFMLKYHGQAASVSKAKKIPKYYLVITYDKGMVAVWGTASEYSKFIDLQYHPPIASPEKIEL